MALVIVPRILREKLGEDGADALVSLFNEANGQTRTDVLTFVEEKFERRLSEETGALASQISGLNRTTEHSYTPRSNCLCRGGPAWPPFPRATT
jgi:hypothetical protein